MFKIGTNKLEKEVYMQKISRNRYKLMKIRINIPINIKIRDMSYFLSNVDKQILKSSV